MLKIQMGLSTSSSTVTVKTCVKLQKFLAANIICSEVQYFIEGLNRCCLHLIGKPAPVTWTRLAQTATAGTKVIVLQQRVSWQQGDKIVIATTGDHLSMGETEEVTIQSVAADNMTITLEETLNYTHLGVSETLCNGKVVEFRAEVGWLTRNVIVRGSKHVQWDETIEACDKGPNVGK